MTGGGKKPCRGKKADAKGIFEKIGGGKLKKS